MSKSEFWTRAQVERLRALYHLHTNGEIAEIMGITLSAVEHMASKLRLKKRSKKAKVHLTREQIEWFRANYANTTNAEITARLNLKLSTMHRLARAYGNHYSTHPALRALRKTMRGSRYSFNLFS